MCTERIAGGGWNGREWVGHRVSGPDRSHMPNAAHMDSPPWGALKSDFFLMYSAEQPEAGGESWFLDGYGVMVGLEQRHQHTLWNVPTQNVTARNRGDEPVWRSIPAKRTRAGRIMLRVPNGGCAPAHPFAAGSCSPGWATGVVGGSSGGCAAGVAGARAAASRTRQ